MIKYLNNYFGKSIKRMVMASFVFVLLVPIAFFIYSLYQNSWEQAEQDMLEKHALISTALVEPFSRYISSRQRSLQTVGEELLHFEHDGEENDPAIEHDEHAKHHNIQRALDKYLKSSDDLVSVSYATSIDKGDAHNHLSTREPDIGNAEKPDYSYLHLSTLAPVNKYTINVDFLSIAFNSFFSKTPVVLLKHNILDKNNKVAATLSVEVSLGFIGTMCSKINFGVKGHCAVVDQAGHVISHPNKDWVKEIRDLSKISIVQKMLAGESGTTEFYSPFLKADMVAGFSSIPGLGWGVMIPQPKSELTYAFDKLRKNTLIWLFSGIVIALFMAYLLTNRITKPINFLMNRTNQIEKDVRPLNLGSVPENNPLEISQLWHSFSELLSGLERSNKEIKRLNRSLSIDIKDTKEKLSVIRNDFHNINNKEYLTSLHNRSYFASHLQKTLNQNNNISGSMILINIDDFKEINDEYGHVAGDLALQQVSRIIQTSIRGTDLPARLGGDEFVIYINNTSIDAVTKIAEELRNKIMFSINKYKHESFYVTVSISITSHNGNERISFEEFLSLADKAMRYSKKQGRNMVTAYDTDRSKSTAITV